MRTRTFLRENLALLTLVVSFAVLIGSLVAARWATVAASQRVHSAATMFPGLDDTFAGFGYLVFGVSQFFLVGLPTATVVTLVDLCRQSSSPVGRIKNRVSLTLCGIGWFFLFWNLPALLSESPPPPPTDSWFGASPAPTDDAVPTARPSFERP